MNKLIGFLKKYDFPLHLVTLWDWYLSGRVLVFLSSIWVRRQLWICGCRFGSDLRADGLPVIRMNRRGAISLGDHCLLNSRLRSNLVGKTTPTILDCRGGGSIRFGNNSGCSFAVISSRAQIDIGDHVKIGGNVRIFDHDYHSLNYLDRRDGRKDQSNCRKKPVKIGDDVFIGANSIILKGVTIGDRSIIGAGSVVASSIPSDEIWAGNPARFVKKLERSRG